MNCVHCGLCGLELEGGVAGPLHIENAHGYGKGVKYVYTDHYLCSCRLKFEDQKEFLEHVKLCGSISAFECTPCKKTFTTANKYAQHMQLHDAEHVCFPCERKFTCKGRLAVHMGTHTGELPHKCHTCNKRFPRVRERNMHQLTHKKNKA